MESEDQFSPPAAVNAPNSTVLTLHKESDTPRFENFPKLPLEIRQKIWKHVCYIPRNVGLWCRRIGDDDESSWFHANNIYHPIKCDTNVGVRAILHTSSEARTEALNHYTLEFGDESSGDIDGAEVTFRLTPKIYANFHVDCICLVQRVNQVQMYDYWKGQRYAELAKAKRGMETFLSRLSKICEEKKLHKKQLDTIALSASLYKILLGEEKETTVGSYYHPLNCLYEVLALARSKIIIYHETSLMTGEGPHRHSVGIEDEPRVGIYDIDFLPFDPETAISSHESSSLGIKYKMLDVKKRHLEWRTQSEEASRDYVGTALAPLELATLQLSPTRK